ncbi:Hypothetical predicted protein [Mytilus galloprovincialis]|uniref:Zinc finger PHD-type domain-containing protein n=1 Tax=Mytilus galloprovincialis TaxID=29158 RepID=A0A8B6G0S8_MYTGA|nr:Hypothetical predicted protein [Mytilus galloprovincialis]
MTMKENKEKEDTNFIENDVTSTSQLIQERSTFFESRAMELEIQTHCSVSLEIAPTWRNGRIHSYKSKNEEEEEPMAELGPAGDAPAGEAPAPVQTGVLLVNPVAASPAKRKVGPSLKAVVPTTKPKTNKKACRVCSISKETSFWLGCGYTNPRSKRQDCCYWVHQKCIGLYHRKKEELSKTPFFCPKHGLSK